MNTGGPHSRSISSHKIGKCTNPLFDFYLNYLKGWSREELDGLVLGQQNRVHIAKVLPILYWRCYQVVAKSHQVK